MTSRREVELDAADLQAFRRIAKDRGLPSRAAALYNALADGVRLARSPEGRALLPREHGGRTRGPKLREMWTQDPDEYREWAEALRAADSSPRAVLGSWVAEYIRVAGDLPAMNWPFCEAELAAAV